MAQEYKAGDLSPEDRAAVERILGRELKDQEVVRVSAEDPELEQRIEAHNDLLESMRELHARVAGVPEEELYALIDEAVEHVRHRPE